MSFSFLEPLAFFSFSREERQSLQSIENPFPFHEFEFCLFSFCLFPPSFSFNTSFSLFKPFFSVFFSKNFFLKILLILSTHSLSSHGLLMRNSRQGQELLDSKNRVTNHLFILKMYRILWCRCLYIIIFIFIIIEFEYELTALMRNSIPSQESCCSRGSSRVNRTLEF